MASFKTGSTIIFSITVRDSAGALKSPTTYMKIEILKGKIIYLKDSEKMYDKASETIKEFNDFKKEILKWTNQLSITY